MSRIIKKVVEESLVKIESELATIYKDIEDFVIPVTMENLQEKIDGRLSSKNLQKNHERRLVLENELCDLKNFIYSNKDLMDSQDAK